MSISSAVFGGFDRGAALGRRIATGLNNREVEDEEIEGVEKKVKKTDYNSLAAKKNAALDKSFARASEFEDKGTLTKLKKEYSAQKKKNTAEGLKLNKAQPTKQYKETYDKSNTPSFLGGLFGEERKNNRVEAKGATFTKDELKGLKTERRADYERSRFGDNESADAMMARHQKGRTATQTYNQNEAMNPLIQENQGLVNQSNQQKVDFTAATQADDIIEGNLGSEAVQAGINQSASAAASNNASAALNELRFTQSAATFDSIQENLELDLNNKRFDKKKRDEINASNELFKVAVAPGEGRRAALNTIMGQGLPMFNDPKLKDSDNSMKQGKDGDYYMFSKDGKRGTNMTDYMMDNPEGLMTAQLYAQASISGDSKDLTSWLSMQDKGDYYSLYGQRGGRGSGSKEKLYQNADVLNKQLTTINAALAENPDDEQAHNRKTKLIGQIQGINREIAKLGSDEENPPFDPNDPEGLKTDKTKTPEGAEVPPDFSGLPGAGQYNSLEAAGAGLSRNNSDALAQEREIRRQIASGEMTIEEYVEMIDNQSSGGGLQ